MEFSIVILVGIIFMFIGVMTVFFKVRFDEKQKQMGSDIVSYAHARAKALVIDTEAKIKAQKIMDQGFQLSGKQDDFKKVEVERD